MQPEVASVEPADDQPELAYRVRTRYGWRDPASADTGWGSWFTTTVYAVREDDRWVFSNALLRNTDAWNRESVGPVLYIVEPGLSFHVDEARRAIAFTDSVAMAFDVPPLGSTTYYLTSSQDAAYRLVGVEFAATLGAGGGFARPVNGQVFSGTPALGGAYRHELLHQVLMPLHTAETTVWASEGLATWLGGTLGRGYRDAVARLDALIRTRPGQGPGLESILSSSSFDNAERYPAAAVLTSMIHRDGGIPAVKEFLRSGPDWESFKRGTTRLLDLSWNEIEARWRATIHEVATAVTPLSG